MNKYPGIYEAKDGNIYLYQNKDNYFSYQMEFWRKSDLADAHHDDTNITAEYLTNTYGKVESKEHAEFIVKLAEVAGFANRLEYKGESCFFNFYNEGILDFWIDEFSACALGEKKITIPLPPKESKLPEVNSGTPIPEVKEPKKVSVNEIQVNVKNNTDSVVQVTKSDDESNIFIHVNDLPKSKEWPQVGDEVLIDLANHNAIYGHNIDGKKSVVRSVFKDGGTTVYAVSHDGACYCFVGGILKKPPTPEEDLARLIYGLGGANTNYCEHLAKAIINGEIKGLEYKPQ